MWFEVHFDGGVAAEFFLSQVVQVPAFGGVQRLGGEDMVVPAAGAQAVGIFENAVLGAGGVNFPVYVYEVELAEFFQDVSLGSVPSMAPVFLQGDFPGALPLLAPGDDTAVDQLFLGGAEIAAQYPGVLGLVGQRFVDAFEGFDFLDVVVFPGWYVGGVKQHVAPWADDEAGQDFFRPGNVKLDRRRDQGPFAGDQFSEALALEPCEIFRGLKAVDDAIETGAFQEPPVDRGGLRRHFLKGDHIRLPAF